MDSFALEEFLGIDIDLLRGKLFSDGVQGLCHLAHITSTLHLFLPGLRSRQLNFRNAFSEWMLHLSRLLQQRFEVGDESLLSMLRRRKLVVELIVLLAQELRDVRQGAQVNWFAANAEDIIIWGVYYTFCCILTTLNFSRRHRVRGPVRAGSFLVLRCHNAQRLEPASALFCTHRLELDCFELECLINRIEVYFLTITL